MQVLSSIFSTRPIHREVSSSLVLNESSLTWKEISLSHPLQRGRLGCDPVVEERASGINKKKQVRSLLVDISLRDRR